MEYFILKCLIELNHIDEDILMNCMRLSFDWANTMGLHGKVVSGITLSNSSLGDPMNIRRAIFCKIQCTKEEREQWDEIQRLNIIHNVLCGW